MASVGSRTEPNIEAIAAQEPDLVLGNKAGVGGVYDKLSPIAPTVLTEGTGVNWKQDFLLTAAALGRSEQARRYLDSYHGDAASLGKRFSGKAPTVSFVRFNPGRARMYGVSSFAGSIAWDAIQLRSQLGSQKLFANLAAVKEQRYVFVDLVTVSALRTPMVRGIHHALDVLTPELSRALG
jgi:ABC-type Fe3+-hydroxamate transport system substrate-binding protein